MKKPTRSNKLALTTETLRLLTNVDLYRANGGSCTTDTCPTAYLPRTCAVN